MAISGVHWYTVYKTRAASLKTHTNVAAVWETEARPLEGKGRACQVGECGEDQGAGMQVTCSEAIDWAMWLEERRVSRVGRGSVAPLRKALSVRVRDLDLIP